MIPHEVQRAYDLTIQTYATVGGGFSGAVVFRATTNDGRELAIRGTPKSVALPSTRMWRLQTLLQEISRNGCQLVPVPLPPATILSTTEDSSVLRFHSGRSLPWFELDEMYWQVEPWMPGASVAGEEVTAEHARGALQALNQFHQLAAEAVKTVGSDEWFHIATRSSPAVQRRLQIATELTQGELDTFRHHFSNDPDLRFRSLAVRVIASLQSRLPWLDRELTAIASLAFPIQPVLRDVWRAHVLFTNTRVTGLIDLSASATDHVTVDIARLTRSYFGADVCKIRDALEQYQLLRPLDASEKRLLSVLDAATVLLSPVTWLRRRLASGSVANCSNDVIARLTELTNVAEAYSEAVLK